MINFNLDKLNVDETELKAFIHQKINEIQSKADGAPVAMKLGRTNDDQYIVRIVATHSIGEIHAECTSDSIYEAIAEAKNSIIDCVNEPANHPDHEEERPPSEDESVEKKYKH